MSESPPDDAAPDTRLATLSAQRRALVQRTTPRPPLCAPSDPN